MKICKKYQENAQFYIDVKTNENLRDMDKLKDSIQKCNDEKVEVETKPKTEKQGTVVIS